MLRISCTGSHVEIVSTLHCLPFFQVQLSHYKKFQGLITKVCEECFSATKNLTPNVSCWQANEGKVWCPGKCQDIQPLIVSIPVVLAIEVGDESVGPNQHLGADQQYWDFPATITLDSQTNAKRFGVIYDLIGYVLVSVEGDHFIARYTSHDKKKVYMYDSLKYDGCPYEEHNASLKTHITGSNIDLPEGFIIWQAYYCLRGGLVAQRKFYETRRKQYATRYHLHFSENTIDNLPSVSYRHETLHEMLAKDRIWMNSPEKSETTEYIPPQPRVPPEERTAPNQRRKPFCINPDLKS